MTEIKICGLTSEEDIRIVNDLRVDYAGFVFVNESRRSVTPAISQHLVSEMNEKIKSVALFVNGSVGDIESALEHVDFDYIQLHGNESVKKVEDLSLRFGKPIIKAIGVSDKFNINNITEYFPVVDKILLDAKPTMPSNLPGGNGEPFSWEILKSIMFPVPWMLAGGLDCNNITTALEVLSPNCVDVSSGVEGHSGKKSFGKVSLFVKKVRSSCYA